MLATLRMADNRHGMLNDDRCGGRAWIIDSFLATLHKVTRHDLGGASVYVTKGGKTVERGHALRADLAGEVAHEGMVEPRGVLVVQVEGVTADVRLVAQATDTDLLQRYLG